MARGWRYTKRYIPSVPLNFVMRTCVYAIDIDITMHSVLMIYNKFPARLCILRITTINTLKAALYTIVPRSSFFSFCTPKYCRLQMV